VVEDRVVTTQEDKHRILLEHFEGVLGQARTRSTSLDLAAFHHAGIDLSVLDVPFSEDEVWATIKALPAGRAPGPDGFTGCFYKSCWQIIKSDMMAALVSLHQGDLRNSELSNSAYLTLVPKKPEELEAKDYSPTV
jgi:hypothetical protein